MGKSKGRTVSKNRTIEGIFRGTKNLTLMGLLGGISMVLGYFTIAIGDYIKIGFSGIPGQLAACLFGPAAGGIFGGALDILKYVLKPTGPFFPGFTISAAASGVIYGIAFHQKNVSFLRILGAKLMVVAVVDILMNTYWLSLLYGKGFLVILPLRILKNLIMLPIDSMILYIVMVRLKGLWYNIGK